MPRGLSIKSVQQKLRQDEIRASLSTSIHISHVIKSIDYLEDFKQEMSAIEVSRMAKVIDAKLALIKKYLPDLKSVEVISDKPINVNHFNLEHSFVSSDGEGQEKVINPAVESIENGSDS